MKIKSISILLLVFLLTNLFASAQEEIPTTENPEKFKGFYLGGTISSNGWGGEVKYIFNKRFTVRSGYEMLNYSYNYDYTESDIDFDATVDYKSGGVSLLGDFNFTRNFFVSAGILFNNFNPKVTGYAAEGLRYGDIIIAPSMVGEFEITLTSGLQVSPYGSIGFRGFFGENKRVVLSTEVGVYYMGSPEIDIKATGLLAPTADPAHGQKEVLENQVAQYKFYPVLKLNLAVKLF